MVGEKYIFECGIFKYTFDGIKFELELLEYYKEKIKIYDLGKLYNIFLNEYIDKLNPILFLEYNDKTISLIKEIYTKHVYINQIKENKLKILFD